MTFTLPSSSRLELIDHIIKFCSITPPSKGNKHSLRDWQHIAGWLNWSFNAYPLLRPSLNNLYPKISGKDSPNAMIWVNQLVRDDLLWAADHLHTSSGVYLLRATNWQAANTNIVIYCDACIHGMGFWYPNEDLAFYSPSPLGIPNNVIFYYEALCVLSSLHHVTSRTRNISRIAIFTDNSNTVDIFNSLCALPSYNNLLKSAVDVLLCTDHQLRVFHVPGHLNLVADCISRKNFAHALQIRPHLSIDLFQPPQVTMGAAKK